MTKTITFASRPIFFKKSSRDFGKYLIDLVFDLISCLPEVKTDNDFDLRHFICAFMISEFLVS